jgi:1-acyl-sn-glycerol-3-phosphate acyltransferase
VIRRRSLHDFQWFLEHARLHPSSPMGDTIIGSIRSSQALQTNEEVSTERRLSVVGGKEVQATGDHLLVGREAPSIESRHRLLVAGRHLDPIPTSAELRKEQGIARLSLTNLFDRDFRAVTRSLDQFHKMASSMRSSPEPEKLEAAFQALSRSVDRLASAKGEPMASQLQTLKDQLVGEREVMTGALKSAEGGGGASVSELTAVARMVESGLGREESLALAKAGRRSRRSRKAPATSSRSGRVSTSTPTATTTTTPTSATCRRKGSSRRRGRRRAPEERFSELSTLDCVRLDAPFRLWPCARAAAAANWAMLEFSDASYRFFPAEPSPFLIRVGRFLNRRVVLPGRNHRIAEIRLEGETEAVREARACGERLLFVFNHPSHSDPQVVTEVQRRLGLPASFMAAYDVFLRSRFNAWCMQKLGNFSVDREAADRKAMAAAISTVTAGGYALNIFPEGNVYLTNDRVTPFLDGTAFIALKARQALDGVGVKIVPVSLKFTHLGVPRETLTRRLVELGRDSGHAYAPGSVEDPVGALLSLGRHLVGERLRRHGFLHEISDEEASLFEVLERFATGLVEGVEGPLGLNPPKSGGLVDRIRKVRSAIHQIRTEASESPRPEIDGLAERAILALRVHGYLTPYLTEHPTLDRYDETVERVAEDFYSRAMPRTGARRAIVRVHAPLDAAGFLEEHGSLKAALPHLTRAMEGAVQAGLDTINASNDAPGARLVGELAGKAGR